MYKSVWRSIITSNGAPYSERELGEEAGIVNGVHFIKESHTLRNMKGSSISMTLYVPVEREVGSCNTGLSNEDGVEHGRGM